MQKISDHISNVVGAQGAENDPELVSTLFASMLASEIPEPDSNTFSNDPDMALAFALFKAVNGVEAPKEGIPRPKNRFFPGADLPASRPGRRPAPLVTTAAFPPPPTTMVMPIVNSLQPQMEDAEDIEEVPMTEMLTNGQTVDQPGRMVRQAFEGGLDPRNRAAEQPLHGLAVQDFVPENPAAPDDVTTTGNDDHRAHDENMELAQALFAAVGEGPHPGGGSLMSMSNTATISMSNTATMSKINPMFGTASLAQVSEREGVTHRRA